MSIFLEPQKERSREREVWSNFSSRIGNRDRNEKSKQKFKNFNSILYVFLNGTNGKNLHVKSPLIT